ncbi:prophage integrase [[Pasteurella] mairii]|uniref:Prophage integrase n=1 Tax=[Pasteurella] mairii TaxID=757 RepID=A0A379B2J6_9PAST|nr:prophage integrase [[Pasteurella] mairii]
MAKSVKPLNDTQIKTVKSTKPIRLSDGNNLFLFINPSKNGKSLSKIWQFLYSHPKTKKRIRKNIGVYPTLSLRDAREIVRNYHSLLNQCIDPFEYAKEMEIKERQNQITVREMAENWKNKKAQEVLERTLENEYRRLELWLFPIFGDEMIKNITLPKAIELLEPIHQAHPDTARKITGYFVNILDRAVALGYLAYNPIANLKKEFKKVAAINQPCIHYSELPEFLKALNYSNRLMRTKLLVEWQLLTMVRPTEAVSVEWSEIDFHNRVWNIPALKMKGKKDKKLPHSVPLSTQAIMILEEMKKYCSGSSFIFPHRTDRNSPCSNETANNAIKSINYKGRLTAHGMRSTARTYLTDIGIDHFVAEACLAHRTGSEVSRVYNRSNYLEARREAMQKWGDYVEKCKKS